MVIVVVAIAADGFVLFFIWSSSCFRSKGLSYEYMSKLRYISLCGSAGILLLLLSGVGCKTIGQNSIFVLWMTVANGHFYCATVEQLSENVSVVLCKKSNVYAIFYASAVFQFEVAGQHPIYCPTIIRDHFFRTQFFVRPICDTLLSDNGQQ